MAPVSSVPSPSRAAWASGEAAAVAVAATGRMRASVPTLLAALTKRVDISFGVPLVVIETESAPPLPWYSLPNAVNAARGWRRGGGGGGQTSNPWCSTRTVSPVHVGKAAVLGLGEVGQDLLVRPAGASVGGPVVVVFCSPGRQWAASADWEAGLAAASSKTGVAGEATVPGLPRT